MSCYNNLRARVAPMLLLACAVATCLADRCGAADAPKQATAQPAIQGAPWFKQRDKNGDGKLAREEFWDATLFAKVDADQDGFATPDELREYYTKNPPQRLKKPNDNTGSVVPARPAAAEPTQAAANPDDVEKRPVVIWSDGTRMAGDLYLPKNRKPGEKLPGIVFCAGTGGTKKGLPTRLGPILARAGFICLGFDYRGWGESESQILVTGPMSQPNDQGEVTVTGKPIRWQMNLMDQTFDIRCAISYLAGEPEVDPNRIGLFGSSYGGGLVTLMAAIDPRVKCVAAQVSGLGIGPAADKFGYDLLTKQARGDVEPVPMETGKLGGKMERYENMRSNRAKSVGFGEKYEVVGRIRVPMIFIDAENEELSNPKENGEKFAAILREKGVPVEYHVIKGITHYGIYREGFEDATQLELAWFKKHLQSAASQPAPGATTAKPAAPPAETPPSTPPQLAVPKPSLEQGFSAMDADRDGKLTASEFETIKVGAKYFREHPEAVGPVFKKLDVNEDATLTWEEYRGIALLRSKAGEVRPASPPPQSEKKVPAKTNAQAAPAPSNADIAFFEKSIRPLLVAKCYECHSAGAKELKGGLALDTREAIRRGGESGPAVVPGDVQSSLLIAALRHEDGLEMPPKEKLSEQQVADFVRWIEIGAPDPRDGTTTTAKKLDLDKGREFWAFQPPRKPAPPAVKNAAWALTDVDRFLAAAQQKAGLTPVGDAEPYTLVRRLYFDLVGLPPTPEESEAFVGAWQSHPQQALEQTVDRLLVSPRFGERWGRHWLDVARYAESSGKETSFAYPQAWRYRDYVIDSFNADVPFDQMIREQIAGDLLPAQNEDQRAERIIATGFLALGPKSHIERNPLQFEMDLVDEQIDATMQAFMGLTVACARCHDHKFDPIPQRDYYALGGIFRSTDTYYGTIPVIQNNNPSTLLTLPAGAHLPAGIPPASSEELAKLDRQIAEASAKMSALTKERKFASLEFVQTRILLATLKAKPAGYEADGTPKLLAMGVGDRDEPRDSPLYVRGEVEKPGDVVPRGFLQVLRTQPAAPQFKSGSGRLELAEWIAARDNPLTARVYVNRVWSKLFGRGLVPTLDNFGASGQLPSQPELLDYLAVTFVEDGWSTKKLVRMLLLSHAYRLSTEYEAANFQRDSDNALLWRMSPRRLDAEAVRDAMLATAGVLDLKPPVGSVVARGGEGYSAGVERGGQLLETRFNCRSVYLPVIRGRAFESVAVFDGVDGSSIVGERSETTVPSQSLYLLNSPYVMKLAETAAAALSGRHSDPDGRIDWAYRLWFGRPATEAERRAALGFVEAYRDRAEQEGQAAAAAENAAWSTFCQSLWAGAEFLARR